MAISEYNYIPTYIRRIISNKPKDVVTASYWNELFNLLITQGDHTAEELGNILNHFTAAITEVKGIADDKYVKPTNGIPKTDLAADVQTSLSKADTALQTHQSLAAYRTAFAQDVIDSDLGDRISTIESKESGWNSKQDKLTAGNNITIADDGTISSTGGGAKAFFLNVFVITETEVVTNKTYVEIKAAIDAGDIIYITDKNNVVYMPQVAKTGSKIEFLWLDSHENRTYRWSAVVNSENVWSVTFPEFATTDELGNLSALKTQAADNLVVAINEVKQTTDTKQDKLIAGENITIAADGKTISAIGGSSASIVMRVNSGYIQYSTDNGNTWSNLIAEADLKGEKGDTGATGPQGVKGDKGDTGSQGLQGIQGPKGDKGDTGPKGEQGPSGVSPTITLEETASGVIIDVTDATGTSTAYLLHGDKGDKGDTGATGPQGIQGARGPQGEQGPAGATGATGPQGLKGDKGDIGPQGPKGDKGDPGADGISLYTTTQDSALETTPFDIIYITTNDRTLVVGDLILTPTGRLYRVTSVSTSFVDAAYITSLRGPQGVKGDKGDTGATGPQGETGPTGPAGPQGSKGDKGDTGDTGPQGLQGIQGPKGDTGPQGLKGDTGATGAPGSQGPKGDKGDKGDTGPKGEQGPSGVSPTITLEETASGVIINVTSDSSTTSAYVLHGQSAYDAARNGGYTDTQANFYTDLAATQGFASGLANKQDTIGDLETIRSGAAKGATALQSVPSTYRTASAQDAIDNDLSDRVSAIEGKEAGWNGKYAKPTGGIPKTDLADAVQTSLGKADSALQSHQSLAAYRTASAQDTIDNKKVDKVTGKGLSTNDYTAAAKAKVDAIPAHPKYTDTVYDDTAVRNRLTNIEKNEDVTLTANTSRISNVSYTAKYFQLLGIVFVRIYGKIKASLNAGYDYDLFTIDNRVPDSNAALSVKCGKDAMAIAKTSSNGNAIQIRPLESGINGYDVYITGFWFV